MTREPLTYHLFIVMLIARVFVLRFRDFEIGELSFFEVADNVIRKQSKICNFGINDKYMGVRANKN